MVIHFLFGVRISIPSAWPRSIIWIRTDEKPVWVFVGRRRERVSKVMIVVLRVRIRVWVLFVVLIFFFIVFVVWWLFVGIFLIYDV
jgi:hypothetical protein